MSSTSRRDLQHLAAIVTLADDAIISKDNDNIITSWNPAAARIFGYTESEAVGQSGRLIVPAELYSEDDEVNARIGRGETVHHNETSRLRKDGHRIWVSASASAITTPNGEVVGVSVIERDVTEGKRLERDARHLAAIVDSSDDAIVSKDLNGTVMSWNSAAQVMFATPRMK